MAELAGLRTERLLLRRWHPADRAPFAAMNADPEVMEHFPAALTRAESDALIDRIEAGFEARGFGLWAVEVTATGEFIGFTGLAVPGFDAPFTPAVEIGWRLSRAELGARVRGRGARGAPWPAGSPITGWPRWFRSPARATSARSR